MAKGGARPGAGRPSKEEAERRARVIAEAAKYKPPEPPFKKVEAARAAAGLKLSKDILSEAANYFRGLAAQYQPGQPAANPKLFRENMVLAGKFAAQAAPYESPTFASIRVSQTPLDLGRLTNEELEQLEHLHLKAAIADGDTGGAPPSIN